MVDELLTGNDIKKVFTIYFHTLALIRILVSDDRHVTKDDVT